MRIFQYTTEQRVFIKGIGAAFILATVIYIGFLAQTNALLQELAAQGGYVSVFLLALINGFNVFVPFVTTSFIPTWVAAGLSFPLLIILITVGMTIADSIAFLIGKWGRAVLSRMQQKTFSRLSAWRDNYFALPLMALFFWASVVPLPNEIVLIPLGILHYRFVHVVPVVFAGNVFFNVLTAIGFLNVVAFL